MLSDTFTVKLKTLPENPGVYFHKDKSGEIIYVGKAAVLKNRVRSYFQKSITRDPKTIALVAEITDTDWMVVDSEIEALFLEAEMIRRYMPRYNILLRDDKSLSYIRIDYDSDYPTVGMTRRPLDDGARYFGPYLSSYSVKMALKYLRRVFPYATKKSPNQKRATLHYHLGLDPGLEEGRTSLKDYRTNLRGLISYISGDKTVVVDKLEKQMLKLAKTQEFEQAAIIRNRLNSIKNLSRHIVFSDKEFLDISKDHALNELIAILGLTDIPRRIEGYDISHMSGTDVVASMVVFTNGVSDKGNYRKFKTKKDHNNDFYNMNETIGRRLSEKNVKAWGIPNLLLIDGGKGQLGAAINARDARNTNFSSDKAETLEAEASLQGQTLQKEVVRKKVIPMIGLAKREEQIVVSPEKSNVNIDEKAIQKLGGYIERSEDYILINLPHHTNVVKLLQRIRDESHRFAVSYHSVLKRARQTDSELDKIPGVGEATRKKLIRYFGSLRAVKLAELGDLQQMLGDKKGSSVYAYLKKIL